MDHGAAYRAVFELLVLGRSAPIATHLALADVRTHLPRLTALSDEEVIALIAMAAENNCVDVVFDHKGR